ncbi:MAG TPA: J domain-containing protein [Xanthobacteraceae bacterium]|nr:J domain-containing protein [Xanthobacteraceae bacterium]
MRTHYDALGIRPDADDEAIRLAFRMLAKAWHPDANAGDHWSEQRFKRISAAYVTLRNPASRAAYDERLEAAGRRRREQRTREILYGVIAATVTFVVASGGILVLRQQHAVTASVDAPPAAEPLPRTTMATQGRQTIDEQTTLEATFATATGASQQHHRIARSVEPPRDEAASSPSLRERVEDLGVPTINGEAAGEAARRSAMRAGPATPMDTAEVHVRTGGTAGDVVRTLTVPREQSQSADEPGGTQDQRQTAAIRVWTARWRDSPDASYRMQQFIVEREQQQAARWFGVTMSVHKPVAAAPVDSR